MRSVTKALLGLAGGGCGALLVGVLAAADGSPPAPAGGALTTAEAGPRAYEQLSLTLSQAEYCREMRVAGKPEITQYRLKAVESFMRHTAVPARRNLDDPRVQQGERLFAEARCAVCHVPALRTGEVPGQPSLSNQLIRPYSDLLLHDMGEELADNRPDSEATGREWRTPPLWGIGLTEAVNGNANYLHDGRARTLTEAILWHGGEAEVSRAAFKSMTSAERQALVAFLQCL